LGVPTAVFTDQRFVEFSPETPCSHGLDAGLKLGSNSDGQLGRGLSALALTYQFSSLQ
jgi:hypothetical protein